MMLNFHIISKNGVKKSATYSLKKKKKQMKIRERENYSSFYDSIQSQFQKERQKKEEWNEANV